MAFAPSVFAGDLCRRLPQHGGEHLLHLGNTASGARWWELSSPESFSQNCGAYAYWAVMNRTFTRKNGVRTTSNRIEGSAC
jgi:hypothetical protein